MTDLTPEQKKNQKMRSYMIALSLIVLVVMVYVLTLVKMGPEILNRAL